MQESDKIQNPSMVRTISKLGIEENFLKLIKTIYKKISTAHIILNGKKFEASQGNLKLPCSPWMSWSPCSFNIMLEVLANAISQEKEIQGIQIGKEKTELSLFRDDMIIYIENPKESTKTF